MLPFILMTSSTSCAAGASVPAAHSSLCVSSVMMHHDNNCARQTVTQDVEIWSISLSLMALITHASVQVPITSGTLLPNADPS